MKRQRNRWIGSLVFGSSLVLAATAVVPRLALAQAPADKAAESAAAAAALSGPPKPPPELEAFMKGFDGSWKCESKLFANAMGPGSPEMIGKSTVKFRKDLDGFFWRGEYDMKKSKTNPGMKGIFYVGYDPGSQRFLMTGVDNGGGFGTATGTVEGETVTFMGEQTFGGKKMKTRETMGKKGPKEATHKIEVDTGSGMAPFAEDTCKK